MKASFTLFLIFTALVFHAQTGPVKRTCGTEIPDQSWNDWFNAKVEEYKKNNSANKENASYVIPVVFHVIHSGQSVGNFPNLSQAQIDSQIKILNDDYAGTGYNTGNISNTTFNPALIANCNITFCLAGKDPNGTTLSEKGIERIDYSSKGWANPTSFTTIPAFKNYIDNTVKAATIWDARRYLNIWISDVNTTVGLLGYATFPPTSGLTGIPSGPGTLQDDGVWSWSRSIGDVGSLASFYNKGRTLTHEIGHYLGLRHIWGDGSCATDYCTDTPTQQQENTTCPTFPHISCNNGPNGDMFINFMDYCYDECLYMFTNDQRTRMQAAMANSPLRMQLSASAATLCGIVPEECSYLLSNFSTADTLQSYRRVTAVAGDAGCLPGPGKAGYTTGTNCYGDREKAEFIAATKYFNVGNPAVTGVVVLFFQYGNLGTDGTGNVGMKLYAGSSATAQPGVLLGSTYETLSTIAASTNTTGVTYCGNPSLAFSIPLIMPYKFVFPAGISVPKYGGFFASVELPTEAGDTVSIMDKRTGLTNTAWEKWSTGAWHDMKDAWGNVRNFNLAILPIVECAPVGIKESSILNNSIDLFPNPSNGNFTIVTTLPVLQTITVSVYDVLGKIAFRQTLDGVKQNLIEVKMENHSNGIYFVEINNGEERIVKRMIVTH